MDLSINIWAVLVAGAASMVLGSLWYSKVLFGKSWMELVGISEKDMKDQKFPAAQYIGSLIMALIMAFTIAYLVRAFDGKNWIDGALIAAMVSIGVNVTMKLNHYLFDDRPMKLFLINAGYDLILAMIMGAIIGAWQIV